MGSSRLVLIDGHSLIYRAFFALPPTLTTSDGLITNAVYGFTSMLLKLLKDEEPAVVVVALDKGEPTFRHERYEDYKSHREETPEALENQFPLVREILNALQIPQLEMAGYEADDILATLAKKGEGEGHDVLIVSGDRDVFQLVSDKVKVLTTRRGISDVVLYDREKVLERYGLPPERMVDLLGLKGDPSDNIPGVAGIGEKTAVRLLQEFGDLEGVIANVESISPTRFREAVRAHTAEARLSKELAQLDTDVPIDIDFQKERWRGGDRREIDRVFTMLEFGSLLSRYYANEERKVKVVGEPLPLNVRPIVDVRGLERLEKKVLQERQTGIALETEGESIDCLIKSMAWTVGKDTFLIKMEEFTGEMTKLWRALKPLLEGPGVTKSIYDTKAAWIALRGHEVEMAGPIFDPLLAAYLLDPTASKYPLKGLAEDYLGAAVDGGHSKESLGLRAVATIALKKPLEEALDKSSLRAVFDEIEQPLAPVLARMETAGVRVDTASLESLSKELDVKLAALEADIYRFADEDFNINSPQQVGRILFEKLGLSSTKKTKTGHATDFSVLVKLVGEHPIVEGILSYRELSKLKSTYVDALPKMIRKRTGRLHTSFNQTITATGRLSSSNPNLQNIPVRSDYGLRIREAFVPSEEGHELIVADYSQIELRLLAHLSGDETMLGAFESGLDIHSEVASEIFGLPAKEVSPSQRRAAKAVNFGIVYGISPPGLSQQLGISVDQAGEYIERYFRRYSRVNEYIKEKIAEAYRLGLVKTTFGRIRRLPELQSGNYRLRSLGERVAINSPLQGSAADIIKLAMIRLDKVLREQGLRSTMVLQVHDELVCEVVPEEKDAVEKVVREAMEGVCELRAPLKVSIHFGRSWREAK